MSDQRRFDVLRCAAREGMKGDQRRFDVLLIRLSDQRRFDALCIVGKTGRCPALPQPISTITINGIYDHHYERLCQNADSSGGGFRATE